MNISVSISSNLADDPIFLCDSDPQSLVISFISALEVLADKSKAELRSKFLSIEQTIQTKVNAIYEKLGNRTNQKSDSKIEYEDESEEQEDEVSTQFLRMQKSLIELQQQYERYVNTLCF